MTKIRALYINEMIKISKKISILVMAAIMIFGTIGFGALMKLQENLTEQDYYRGDDQEWMQEEMKRTINDLEDEIENLQSRLEDIDKEADSAAYEETLEMIASNQDHLEINEMALDQGIMLMFSDNYLTDTLYKTTAIKEQIRQLERQDGDESKAEAARLQDLLEKYQQLIVDKNFSTFIELEKEAAADDPFMSDSDKKIESERLDLWYKIDPTGGVESSNNSYVIQETLNVFSTTKRSLAEGLDYSNPGGPIPLTPTRQSDLENELAVLIYKTENKIEISSMGGSLSSTALEGMASFGITMIVLMILILAGGAVSQEIATGSIKSLIIAPVKRWKIFTAKLLSLLTIGVIALLVHFVVTFVSYGLFFGFDTMSPYIFAVGGQAGAMSPVLYLFAGQGVRFIEVIVFMAFALMLSVLTRNTAAAVGISMAAYFGTSLASQLLYFLPAAEWIKFMPFDHLNLTAKFFPFAVQDMYGMVNQNETTLLFSLIYIVVALICMLYTALDSFNRRDIK